MDAERWRRIRDAVEAAIGLDAAVRASILDRFALAADDRREAEALLAAHDASGDFLVEPASALTHLVADTPLSPGRMLGTYRIDREIGRGGMGIIYRAHDTRLGRDVAIKVLPPALANDARRRARLEREARAAAAVAHPGVGLVYALDADADGTAFIVSELVDGVTLRQELAQGPLPLSVALTTALEIARAVGAAHARGVVHRDLKPENIMRTRDGRVKVLDFGLARVAPWAGRLTLDGEIMGTPGYMAPEQLRGEDSGEAIDIFAMGVLVRELITGQSAAGTADARQVPPDLARVIDRATAPDPAARFASMTELADAIARVAATPASDVTAPSLTWWRVHQAVIATLYIAMVIPAWMIRGPEVPGRVRAAVVLAVVLMAAAVATIRLHWLFIARVQPHEVMSVRRQAAPWLWRFEWGMTIVLLLAAQVAAAADRLLPAAVLLTMAVSGRLAMWFIEPATVRSALGTADE